MFQNDKKSAWKTKFRLPGKPKPIVVGLGTNEERAASKEALLTWLRTQRKFAWLDLILTESGDFFEQATDTYTLGNPAAFFEAHCTKVAAIVADPDLGPLVNEWATQCSEPRYVTQVRRMIPDGTRVSGFTRVATAKWLNSADPVCRVKKLTKQTRSRLKTALSTFAKWLVANGHLDYNPTTGIELYEDDLQKAARRSKKFKYHEEYEVRQLVEEGLADAVLAVFNARSSKERDGLMLPLGPRGCQSMEATMAATSAEWCACAVATPADFKLDRFGMPYAFRARGTKNEKRDRWVDVTEDWAKPYIRAAIDATPRGERIWSHDCKTGNSGHRVAREQLGLRYSTLHCHRHSYAVMWIRRGATGGLRPDGRDAAWLRRQLGHAANSLELEKTYGVYIGEARLEARHEAQVGHLVGHLRLEPTGSDRV